MNNERLKQLLQFLKEEPADPFNLYAIALEYQQEYPQKALQYFETLLAEHPTYTGTYYHAARLYITLNMIDKAEAVFKRGLQITRQEGDHHAHRELQNAYNEYLFEDE